MGGSIGSGAGKQERKAFNAAKSSQLGWYDDKECTLTVGSDFTTRLHGLVDARNTDPSVECVIIKINNTASGDDYFLGFNRNVSFNAQTNEGQNEVMLTRSISNQSFLLVTLAQGFFTSIQDFVDFDLTISVTNIQTDDGMTSSGYAEVTLSFATPVPSVSLQPSLSLAPTFTPGCLPTIETTGPTFGGREGILFQVTSTTSLTIVSFGLNLNSGTPASTVSIYAAPFPVAENATRRRTLVDENTTLHSRG